MLLRESFGGFLLLTVELSSLLPLLGVELWVVSALPLLSESPPALVNNDNNQFNKPNNGEKMSQNSDAGLVEDTAEDEPDVSGRAVETIIEALGDNPRSLKVLSMSSEVNSCLGYTVVSLTLDHFKCSLMNVSARKNVASLLNVFEIDEPSGKRNSIRAELLNSAFLLSASADAAAEATSVFFLDSSSL